MVEKQNWEGEVVHVSRGCNVEELAEEMILIINIALHSSVSPNRDINILLTGQHYE
jgi:hypothetical protein